MSLVGWRRVAGAGGGRRHGAGSFVKKKSRSSSLPLRLATYYTVSQLHYFSLSFYCKQLCTLKRLVNLNVVLEKCSRWKFAAHDEQQYDDHQGKVAN